MAFLVTVGLILLAFLIPWWILGIISLGAVFLFKLSPYIIVMPFVVLDLVYAPKSEKVFGIYAVLSICAVVVAFLIKFISPKILWHGEE